MFTDSEKFSLGMQITVKLDIKIAGNILKNLKLSINKSE